MDVKRIFRGPWFWIVVAVVGVLIALQYLAPNGGYKEINTSDMAKAISSGEESGDGSSGESSGESGEQEDRAAK